MSLENLLAIKRLVKHEAAPGSILKLLAAADGNRNDYSGDTVSDATLTECIVQAESLIRRVREMGLGT